jgi:ComEC/Rec2-related protein
MAPAIDFDRLPTAINHPAPAVIDRPRRGAAAQFFIQAMARAQHAASDGIHTEIAFGHLFYWTPVFVGVGAAYWFSLAQTPAVGPTLFLCVASAIAWLLFGPWRPVLRSIALALLLMTSGALLSAWEAARLATIILDGPVTTTIRGVVTGKEIDASGRWRYDIALMATERPLLKRAPASIRVTALQRGEGIGIGEGIEGRARLSPPSGPALAGLNDFAFGAYFEGNGASGFFYGKPQAWTAPQEAGGFARWSGEMLASLRGAISTRIRAILPGDAGAFAASMVTDDRRAMSRETTEALRLAGLTHIIAISGLNMALAAGLCFVGLRLVLSLSQAFSHRFAVKKFAAAGALVSVTLYYLISGFAVSAERAYVMMAIMLVAVFFGRPSISLRNVALSAILILAMSPSALLGPGFQMSYAATIALITGYSALQRRIVIMVPVSGVALFARLLPAGRFMGGIFLTSLIGGLSTALFSMEHFNRVATWGLPANLLAMPIISFVVMPAGLIALIAMPFGLDWLPVKIMGYGLDFVIAVARWAAAQDGEWVTGRMPAWLFVGMTIGLLVFAIMRSHLRYLGAALVGALLLTSMVQPAAPRPDLVIFEDGSLVGIVGDAQIAISENRPSDFILEQWQRALRLKAIVKPVRLAGGEPPPPKTQKRQRLTPEQLREARTAMAQALGRAAPNRFSCRERHWCVAKTSAGLTIVIALNGAYAGIGCETADIVVTPARLKWKTCRSEAILATGETLRKTGSLEIYLTQSDYAPPTIRMEAALDSKLRPWTRHRFYDWHSGTFAENRD